MRDKIIFSILVLSLTGCSNNVKDLVIGPQSDVSASASASCHQQARNYVKDNWQKIGRDWIKHEEYRQYKICVDKQKKANG